LNILIIEHYFAPKIFIRIMFKKSVFPVLVISIYIGLNLSNVYVQRDFEWLEDLGIRLGIVSFKFGTFLVKIKFHLIKLFHF
jgi:uncharacterized membrane protein (DUF441 family)